MARCPAPGPPPGVARRSWANIPFLDHCLDKQLQSHKINMSAPSGNSTFWDPTAASGSELTPGCSPGAETQLQSPWRTPERESQSFSGQVYSWVEKVRGHTGVGRGSVETRPGSTGGSSQCTECIPKNYRTNTLNLIFFFLLLGSKHWLRDRKCSRKQRLSATKCICQLT